MDKEEKPVGSEDDNGKSANPQQIPATSRIKSRPQAIPRASSSRRRIAARKSVSLSVWKLIAQIVIAIIGVIGTIAVAWLNTRPPTPLSTPALTISLTSTFTSTPTLSLTDTPTLTITPPLTNTNTPTITLIPSNTPTITPEPDLIVLVAYDRSAGRPPLKVSFDARDTYLIDSDGKQLRCRFSACDYTWKVALDGKQLDRSITDSSGKFQYVFGKRGRYLVSVWICRGRDRLNCGGNGIFIEVG